jgi:hypothetical protein
MKRISTGEDACRSSHHIKDLCKSEMSTVPDQPKNNQ